LRRRNTYQNGWLERRPRKNGPDIWVYRWRELTPEGGVVQRSVSIATTEQCPTKAQAKKAAEHRRLAVNPDHPGGRPVTFGALCDRYVAEELPELRHSTGNAYRSMIERHIKSKWGDYPVEKVRPFAVEQWLKTMPRAPKTKGHLRNVMRNLFNCAMRWELIAIADNPMKLVRVRGVSKRQEEPRILSVDEFYRLADELEEPFRTMVILAQCTGLRCSELLALRWCDFDWEGLVLRVRRAIVDGVVNDVKTKYSRAGLPLDSELAEIMWAWKQRARGRGEEDWVFASPQKNGAKPYQPWGLQYRKLRPAARRAGLGEGIGWHTFRHTYASLLRANGEDLKVQQELLRHADIRTTMNHYTQAMPEAKRNAHRKVVQMILPHARLG
jgi:integrase